MNRSTSVAYIDLLTCLFVFFVVAFSIVFAQKKMDEAIQTNIEAKAEFMVLVDWSYKSRNDVDVWLRDPVGDVVSYKKKDQHGITLERDDLGKGGDKDPYRREIITVREYRPGQYTVNVMMFTMQQETPEPVKVQVLKMNPFQIISEREVVLEKEGHEITSVTFWVDDNGKVVNKDETMQERLSGPK